MKEYLNTSRELLSVSAHTKLDRTGVGTAFKTFNHIALDQQLGQRVSIITTKKMNVVSIIGELLGFIRGADSAATFRELGCNVWNANANKQSPEGSPKNQWLQSQWRKGQDDLGRIYGVQWRNWEDNKHSPASERQFYLRDGYKAVGTFEIDGVSHIAWHRKIDQLKNAVDAITNTPENRRIIVSAWNPADLNKGALPPCHVLQHFLCVELSTAQRVKALKIRAEHDAAWYGKSIEQAANEMTTKIEYRDKFITLDEHLDLLGAPKHSLDLNMYQRSADWLLGAPYNITSYATMMAIMGRITNTVPGVLNYITGDTHVYGNHRAAMKEQVGRVPSMEKARLLINPILRSLEDFEQAIPEDFRMFNYQNQGPLTEAAPMAI